MALCLFFLVVCFLLFYLPAKYVVLFGVIILALSIILCGYIKTVKRTFYIMLSFVPIFILQGFSYRGESVYIGSLPIDLYGIKFAWVYLMRVLVLVYFLGSFFLLVSKIKLPQGKTGEEVVRVFLFFSFTRKYFFYALRNRLSGVSLKDIPILLADVIGDTYNRVFKHFPYENAVCRILNKSFERN